MVPIATLVHSEEQDTLIAIGHSFSALRVVPYGSTVVKNHIEQQKCSVLLWFRKITPNILHKCGFFRIFAAKNKIEDYATNL